jgi:magnesium transporter
MSRFQKRHTKPGARPGTLVIPHDATRPVVRLIEYTPETLDESEVRDVEALRAVLARDTRAWIDVHGLGDEALLRRLGAVFALHPLALEDVVNVPQRPKCEPYEDHHLIVTRMLEMEGETRLRMEQVSIFVGKNHVLTVQERAGDVFDPVRERLRRTGGAARRLGPDYLAYALLDAVIDAYFPILERMGELMEELEDEVVSDPRPRSLRKIHDVRRELLTLRRSIWPQREMINALIRDENAFIGETTRLHLRDTYDHCVQIIDGTETYRELAAGLMDVYLSGVGNRQNEVMKVLTVIASIFIPLTFLAGLYGMNFENMPELHYRWSYPLLLATMVAMATAMVVYFRRLGWLGGREDRD